MGNHSSCCKAKNQKGINIEDHLSSILDEEEILKKQINDNTYKAKNCPDA